MQVWDLLKLQNWGQMQDHYVECDILHLHDVFERFRAVCIETYGLDPLHYYTLPGFSWDACLKITGVKLDLLTDIDMYTCLLYTSDAADD